MVGVNGGNALVLLPSFPHSVGFKILPWQEEDMLCSEDTGLWWHGLSTSVELVGWGDSAESQGQLIRTRLCLPV